MCGRWKGWVSLTSWKESLVVIVAEGLHDPDRLAKMLWALLATHALPHTQLAGGRCLGFGDGGPRDLSGHLGYWQVGLVGKSLLQGSVSLWCPGCCMAWMMGASMVPVF